MGIKGLEYEGMLLRAKVPVPFVEENAYLPEKVYVEGYFSVGTVVRFQGTVCSKKIDPYEKQVNDYCHAAALLYSNRLNGAPNTEEENALVFHVDLSALFLLFDPIDEEGNVIQL